MTHLEFGAQPPHRPAPPHRPVPQIPLDPGKAQRRQPRLAPLPGGSCLRPGSQASPCHGTLPPGRPHPPNPVPVQQTPQGAAGSAKLDGHLLQRPRLGDQPVQQVGPHAVEAEFGGAGGGALLGSMLALAGQPLAAGELPDVGVLDRAADGRLGGAKVVGGLGMPQPSSSKTCKHGRRSAKPSRLACWSS
jgi:hypothetical protein